MTALIATAQHIAHAPDLEDARAFIKDLCAFVSIAFFVVGASCWAAGLTTLN
jgi:hypothetical protein